jgi:hypothetical protein
MTNSNRNTYSQEDIINELNNNLGTCIDMPFSAFPDISSYNKDGRMNIMIRLADKNYQLKKSNSMYFNAEINTLIHFTNLKALFSIINEKAVRMYNLNNTNDPEEYSFSASKLANLFTLDNFPIDKYTNYMNLIKENSYILSSTFVSEVSSNFFWDNYADHYNGVAIEFEFVNKSNDWDYGCFVSTVKYNELDWLDSFINIIASHKKKFPNITFTYELDHIMSLHKKPIKRWTQEKEVRLLILKDVFNYPDLWNNLIFKDYNLKNKCVVKYLALPLFSEIENKLPFRTDNFQSKYLNTSIPKLKLSSIFLSSLNKKSYNMITHLSDYFFSNLGYYPQIKFVDNTIKQMTV